MKRCMQDVLQAVVQRRCLPAVTGITTKITASTAISSFASSSLRVIAEPPSSRAPASPRWCWHLAVSTTGWVLAGPALGLPEESHAVMQRPSAPAEADSLPASSRGALLTSARRQPGSARSLLSVSRRRSHQPTQPLSVEPPRPFLLRPFSNSGEAWKVLVSGCGEKLTQIIDTELFSRSRSLSL